MDKHINRRDFLKAVGVGATSLTVGQLAGCGGLPFALGRKLPAGAVYNEKYRPQFHFTPRKFWTND
ncbi:MAG: twin-arginine translocation signal domain-containing protein, partial [Planctomycetota bacterium]